MNQFNVIRYINSLKTSPFIKEKLEAYSNTDGFEARLTAVQNYNDIKNISLENSCKKVLHEKMVSLA